MSGADKQNAEPTMKETTTPKRTGNSRYKSSSASSSEAKGTAKRAALKKDEFGLPGEKKYPVNDKAHAANAKARATQQVKKGNLTASQKAQIDRAANKELGKSAGKAGGKSTKSTKKGK